jgi:hypothetical protein
LRPVILSLVERGRGVREADGERVEVRAIYGSL